MMTPQTLPSTDIAALQPNNAGMIEPEEIRRKAIRLYPSFLEAWLAGTEFFPYVLPANKRVNADSLTEAIAAVQMLRDGSRERIGYGYTVHWEERRSRRFGRNLFPTRIVFESQNDFLRFIRRRSEFRDLEKAVGRLRLALPELEPWIRRNAQLLRQYASDIEALITVAKYLRDNPRPNCFARELPLAIDTKFIESREAILREWLDVLLPPEAILAGEEAFARRYGLRYAEPHWLIRLLDPGLCKTFGLPFQEFSLPLSTLANLRLESVQVIIVENKTNLLTLPPISGAIALGGVGYAATELRIVPWLASSAITYWGDLDAHGLDILSAWRVIFPQTQSAFMDLPTLERYLPYTTTGKAVTTELPPHLSSEESAAFNRCRDANLRLEQEKIPQSDVARYFAASGDGTAACTREIETRIH